MAQRRVPTPFITKTYNMVDDPSSNDVVSWNEDGTTFVVWKTAEFAKVLLPNYFKHNNFSSFIRQLNTYGFRKIAQNKWEFANENFKQGQQELLTEIHRRKMAAPQTPQGRKPGNVASPACSADEFGSSSTGSLDTRESARITDLLDENENLRKDNEMLNLELVQTKRQCNDLISFLTQSMQVEPDQINRILNLCDCEPPMVAEASGCGSGYSNCDEDENEKCVKLFGVIVKKKRSLEGNKKGIRA
ncbi:heat shock factor protein HSF24-like [Primulina huaijiensis]|uniref:heat shock factor protein HSF24-like n=1 Tax=Primulina huaijiensis TaxID=1492673 RepID=UPI003CC77C4C